MSTRINNQPLRWNGEERVSLAADASSDPVRVDDADSFAIQITFAGSAPTGTFKLQTSCDEGTGAAYTQGVRAWTDVASSSQSVTADGTHVWTLYGPAFRWVRVVYTRTSGTATLSGRVNTRTDS